MTKKINRILNIDEAFDDDKNYVIVYCWDRMKRNNSRFFNGKDLKKEIKEFDFMDLFRVGEVDKYGDVGILKYYNKRDNNVIILNKNSDHYFDVDDELWHHYNVYASEYSLLTSLEKLLKIYNTIDYIGFKDINNYMIEGSKLIDKFPNKKEWFEHIFNNYELLNNFLNDHKDIFNESSFKAFKDLKERMMKAYNSFE